MATKTIGILAGMCCLMSAAAALANVNYSYVTDAPTYNVSGGSATVGVYLQEALTSGSTSVIAAENGMSGVGFRVSLTSGGGVKLTGFAPAAGFNGPASSSISDALASLLVSTTSSNSGPTLDGAGRVFVGNLTLGLSGIGAAPATFSVQRYSSLGGNTLTATNGYDLDFNSASPAYNGAAGVSTFVAAVPEPTSMVLLGVGAVMALRRRRA